MTEPERRLWLRLRGRQLNALKFRRQHGIGPYIVDFYCPEKLLVVEIDGESHAEQPQMTSDEERDRYLRSLGLEVVRYSNQDVMTNLDGVLEDLLGRLRTDPTSPSPSLQRRGILPPPLCKGVGISCKGSVSWFLV
ncbi:endonuclease domain-containing protein [Candidatus Nitrospira bockiana]